MRVHRIPSDVYTGKCWMCKRERTCCAVVQVKGRFGKTVLCAGCRIEWEGRWTPEAPLPDVRLPKDEFPEDESRARRLGKGLRARSPSKHGLPFTF